MNEARLLDAGITLGYRMEHFCHVRHRLECRNREISGAQPVIEVVVVIRDIIGQGRGLRFGAGPAVQRQVVACVIGLDG